MEAVASLYLHCLRSSVTFPCVQPESCDRTASSAALFLFLKGVTVGIKTRSASWTSLAERFVSSPRFDKCGVPSEVHATTEFLQDSDQESMVCSRNRVAVEPFPLDPINSLQFVPCSAPV